MISDEQMARAETEFAVEAHKAFDAARSAERALENYTYRTTPAQYDPRRRDELLAAYYEADYLAESRVWIHQMIRDRRVALAKLDDSGRCDICKDDPMKYPDGECQHGCLWTMPVTAGSRP